MHLAQRSKLWKNKNIGPGLCYPLLHNFHLQRSLYQKSFPIVLYENVQMPYITYNLPKKTLIQCFLKNKGDLAYLRVKEDKM